LYYVLNNKEVIKRVTTECYIDPSVLVTDISLYDKASAEDEAFAFDKELWLNVRRGNTLLELFDKDNYKKKLKVVIGRKGLNKFFDLSLDYVTKEYSKSELGEFEFNLKSYMLDPVKEALKQGKTIEVLETLKANGENVQVSWNSDIEAWLIASKNVAIVARSYADIGLYKETRYVFAVLMAECWFSILEKNFKT
jgi:hypothetical protein